MTVLKNLKAAKNVHDLGAMLGYSASSTTYLIYKSPVALRYQTFHIPKKTGGTRTISAPNDALKGLQRRLANALYACIVSIEAESGKKILSHGYRRDRSIISNAAVHKRRRFVLNLDLADFFPTINFGRVRGFFIKSNEWALDPKIATLIAQIACHDNALPQGSPCSPIIADLVAGVLDSRLVRLAKKHTASYSRYADDLTFSSSQKAFPIELASKGPNPGDAWVLGTSLTKEIVKSGFAINSSKTRMQCRPARQVVTGLTVNAKVNIRADYYRLVRAKCLSLFATGAFLEEGDPVIGPTGAITIPVEPGSFPTLEGRLSHIHHVKDKIDQRSDIEKRAEKTSFRKLYARFLFQKYFLTWGAPIILCEGKTDNVYLSLAIKHLPAFHPKLGQITAHGFERNVTFFPLEGRIRKKGHRARGIAKELLEVDNGASGLAHFIQNYRDNAKKCAFRPMPAPVIILIDNDDGADKIFGAMKKYGVSIGFASTNSFFHITDNLYLVKTPGAHKAAIEDLFEPPLLKTPHKGKMFNRKKAHGSTTEYGKVVFAEQIVRPLAAKINWAGFVPLLQSISDVMDDYKPPSP